MINKLLIISIVLAFSMGTRSQDTPSLRDLAEERGILIGTAVEYDPLDSDATYASVLAQHYNMVIPANEMKMRALRPTPDEFTFGRADGIVAFAQENDMQVRGGPLAWHQAVAYWIRHRNLSRDEAMLALEEHIKAVVGHYKGQVFAWDVVNEAVHDSGMALRGTDISLYDSDSLWLTTIGPEYIALAFQWAHEADPDALLFYNDYNTEKSRTKANAVYNLVASLVEQGVPIHGVGFQMHINASEPPDYNFIRSEFARISDLGLQIHITELDVRISDMDTPRSESLQRQADVYREITNICLEFDSCTALITWGFTDRHSWLNTPADENAPLPFDMNYQPKPAFFALSDVLSAN